MRRLLCFSLSGLLVFSCSASAAGYPPATGGYPAPWVDVFSADPHTGKFVCIKASKIEAQACAVTRQSAAGYPTVSLPWFVPSNCDAFAVLRDDCYQADFTSPKAGGTYTVVGQRCLYGGSADRDSAGWCAVQSRRAAPGCSKHSHVPQLYDPKKNACIRAGE